MNLKTILWMMACFLMIASLIGLLEFFMVPKQTEGVKVVGIIAEEVK